jgi:O-succinylhomoserine sulfhydrylase
MSPFNAWVFTKGLETLKLRMQAHCHNANQVAEFLLNHPNVSTVHFSGLKDHPAHKLATRQHHMPGAYGAIMGFEVKATDSANGTQDGIGDAKTTITHPATTTHFRLTAEARAEAGVNDSLIRLSVGLEDAEDIIKDLARGLDSL